MSISDQHVRRLPAVAMVVCAGVLHVSCAHRPTARPVTTVPAATVPVAQRGAAEAAPPTDPRLAPARIALERRDYPQALHLCEDARKEGVPPGAVLDVEAAIFKETAYLDREIDTLKRWTAESPRDESPWLKLFYIYLDLGWRREAGTASQRALRIAPRNPRCQVARALYYYRSTEPALGIPAIQEALRLEPANAEYADLYTTILLKSLRFTDAEAGARAALRLDPQRASFGIALAHALLGQERQAKTDEAIRVLTQIQAREPGNEDAAYELGLLAQKRGDLPEAIRQYERVVARDAQYSNVALLLGRLYIQQGRADDGRKLLATYKKMDDNTHAYDTALLRLSTRADDPGLHYQLARAHMDADELPEAIVELHRTLALRPQDRQAKQDLIAALKRQGRVTEARRLEGGLRSVSHSR